MLERSPLLQAVKTKNLSAFKHTGFWYCMDTVRDKKVLDKMIKKTKNLLGLVLPKIAVIVVLVILASLIKIKIN